MANRADIFPSSPLRDELSRLGISESQHNIQNLEEMMPVPLLRGRGEIFFADDIAQTLIDLISMGLIRIPQLVDESIESLKPGSHTCQLCGSHYDFVNWITAFFKSGLERNEQCVFVTSDKFSFFEAHKIFSEGIPDFNEHFRSRRMEIISYRNHYLDVNGELKDPRDLIESPIRKEGEALKKGFTGLRGAAELSWLCPKDWPKFMEYEEQINTVIRNSSITAACLYSLAECKTDQVIGAAKTHPIVYTKRNQWCHQIEKSDGCDAFLTSLKETHV